MKFRRMALVCAGLLAPGLCCADTTVSDAARRQITKKYEASQILFEKNLGQAPAGVDFVSRGLGREVAVRGTGAGIYVSSQDGIRHAISLNLIRARAGAQGQALEPTEARGGYLLSGVLIGGLVEYGKVSYHDVWPGIDVVYYGTGRELEYDIVLRPGADVRKAALEFSGVDAARINADGDLVLNAGGAEFIQRRPHIYQRRGDRKVEIAGRYRMASHGRVTFQIARYDHAQELVIDPTLLYGNTNLSPAVVSANGIAMDSSGNTYITGQSSAASPGFTGAYLYKLNANGAIIGQFDVVGTGANTLGNAVALDAAGNIYMAGQTAATGLINCGSCGFQNGLGNAAGTHWDGFLIAFASTFPTGPGNNPVTYATYMGGSQDDEATAVAALAPGAVYVAGTTTSANFPATQGLGLRGQSNAFLVKVDTTQTTGPGSELWGRYVGGTGAETGTGVALDSTGSAYLVGTTTSPSSSFSPYGGQLGFAPTKVTPQVDGFLDKIDPTGSTSSFFTYFVNGQAFAVATQGSTAYVTGATAGGLGNVASNAAQGGFGGGSSDAFLFRVDTSQSGNASLIYSTYLGGSGFDQGTGVAADSSGKAYIVGIAGAGFPVKNAIQPTFGGGGSDPFYAVVNTLLSGSGSLLSATYLGSSTTDFASGIAVGPHSVASVSGNGIGTAETWGIGNPSSATVRDDFDGNGTPDLVWLNDATRQVTVNYFGGAGGATLLGWNYLNQGGIPGWHVVAVADFNGDGVPDLVWQNDATAQVTVHYYGGPGGATFLGWNWLNTQGDPGWKVVGAADFNGDGVPDLVWMNNATRQVTVNYFGGAGGATLLGWNYLNSGGIPGWHVAAVADFNGDGVPDLVWQNDSTTQITVHYYGGAGGATFLGWNWLNTQGNPGWQVVGAADFNGDGAPDLLWMNNASRQVTVNYYGGAGGATFQGWSYLIPGGDPGWSVVNH